TQLIIDGLFNPFSKRVYMMLKLNKYNNYLNKKELREKKKEKNRTTQHKDTRPVYFFLSFLLLNIIKPRLSVAFRYHETRQWRFPQLDLLLLLLLLLAVDCLCFIILQSV